MFTTSISIEPPLPPPLAPVPGSPLQLISPSFWSSLVTLRYMMPPPRPPRPEIEDFPPEQPRSVGSNICPYGPPVSLLSTLPPPRPPCPAPKMYHMACNTRVITECVRICKCKQGSTLDI